MDLTARARVAAPIDIVFGVVEDLSTYPSWLGIVLAAVPEDPPCEPPAWRVDLGARIGPLRRSKRLRMARLAVDPPNSVRFERHEQDGRAHGVWVLSGGLTPSADDTTALEMHLHYDGRLWLPGLDLLLNEEVKRAGPRLERYIRGR